MFLFFNFWYSEGFVFVFFILGWASGIFLMMNVGFFELKFVHCFNDE